eukprot:2726023-Pleurochrysis_carterae.AAC.5
MVRDALQLTVYFQQFEAQTHGLRCSGLSIDMAALRVPETCSAPVRGKMALCQEGPADASAIQPLGSSDRMNHDLHEHLRGSCLQMSYMNVYFTISISTDSPVLEITHDDHASSSIKLQAHVLAGSRRNRRRARIGLRGAAARGTVAQPTARRQADGSRL